MNKLKSNQQAFTIIELLVVIPLISVILIVIFTLMINSYGSMLISTSEASLRIEAQSVLLNLQDEMFYTAQYSSDLRSDLSDGFANLPKDSNDSETDWTDDPDGDPLTTPDRLIVHEIALDGGIRNPASNKVYKKPTGNCNGATDLAYNNLIYFTVDSSGDINDSDTYRTLYKRTVTPSYNTCGTVFKRTTCPIGNNGSGDCEGEDAILSKKVTNFQVDYYDELNNLTLIPEQGEKVQVIITLGDKIYGNTIEVESKLTMKKIN